MKSNGEIVEVQYQTERIKSYKDKDEEFYNYYMEGNRMSLIIHLIYFLQPSNLF